MYCFGRLVGGFVCWLSKNLLTYLIYLCLSYPSFQHYLHIGSLHNSLQIGSLQMGHPNDEVLPLPPFAPQPSSPLRCLRCLSPPALVLPHHSPPPDLASRRHLPPSSSATIVVRRRRRCPPPRSSTVAAIIATQLSPASLATVVPSPL